MRFLIALLAICLFFSCQKEENLQKTETTIEKIEAAEITTELSTELKEHIRELGAGTYELTNGAPVRYTEEKQAKERFTNCTFIVNGTVGTPTSTGETFYVVYNVRFPGDTIVTYVPAGNVEFILVSFDLNDGEARNIPATYNGFGGLEIKVGQLFGGAGGSGTQSFVVAPSTQRVFDGTTYKLRCN